MLISPIPRPSVYYHEHEWKSNYHYKATIPGVEVVEGEF